ncbi:type VI secretion system protein TssL [Xylophilus sp. Kf1]|nr:type VI secretion system protein TssL [Xylophilus sp. Kf1]
MNPHTADRQARRPTAEAAPTGAGSDAAAAYVASGNANPGERAAGLDPSDAAAASGTADVARSAGAADPDHPADSDHPADTAQTAEAVVLPAGIPPAQRLAAVLAAANPLLEAAMPLLRLMAELPRALDARGVLLLNRVLEREVQNFQTVCTAAQIRHEYLVAASYALCTAIDEAATSTRWGGGDGGEQVGVWSNHQLAMRFHGDNRGGDKVFLLIGKLAAHPQQHIDLIEVVHAILCLGFEGRYGTGLAREGRRQLETIRHRLFVLLAAARGEVPARLSPQAPVVSSGRFGPLHIVPLRGVCALLLLVLVGLFCNYRIQLGRRAMEVQAQLAALGTLQAPVLPTGARPMRLKSLLEAEIAAGNVTVDEDETRSAVSFRGDGMFAPGQARLDRRTLPLLGKVAQEIRELPGRLAVNGHSDDQPIHTDEFPDNRRLSAARAAAVAAALQAEGVEASRIEVHGLGAIQPLADNRTATGRARNRRVDLILSID